MEFIALETEQQLNEIKSGKETVVIFKHNTTCPISAGVKRKLEQEGDELPKDTPVYLLDLLANRAISDAIADRFSVTHQSPQVLVIKDGQCKYHESLSSITIADTANAIASA